MRIVHDVNELYQALLPYEAPCLVPTMGNLHEGHLSLIRHAQSLGDICVASIFVNRLQFAPHEDFDQYPRTLAADCEALEKTGCALVFAPSENTLYPQAQTFRIRPDPTLSDILEGQYRPGFFEGVCTVVMKLFQCVFKGKSKGYAVLGEKDFQQWLILKKMVEQFALPITLSSYPTVRSSLGLALSSRNHYLDEKEKEKALALFQTLEWLRDQWLSGHRDSERLSSMAIQKLTDQGWVPDYMTIRRRTDLQLPCAQDHEWIALGAARLGHTRLIDNLLF